MYKSSLISHLTFPGKSEPINSFEDLLEEPGYTWGFEPTYGGGWVWLKDNKAETVKEIYKDLLVS